MRFLLQNEALDNLSHAAWLAIGLVVGFCGGIFSTILVSWSVAGCNRRRKHNNPDLAEPHQGNMMHTAASSRQQTTAQSNGTHFFSPLSTATATSTILPSMLLTARKEPSKMASSLGSIRLGTDVPHSAVILDSGAIHINVLAEGEILPLPAVIASAEPPQAAGVADNMLAAAIAPTSQPPTELRASSTNAPTTPHAAEQQHPSGTVSYQEDDLDDDWKVLLGELDDLLQAVGQPCMGATERGVAVRKLIAATGSRGDSAASFALKVARDEVIKFRARAAAATMTAASAPQL